MPAPVDYATPLAGPITVLEHGDDFVVAALRVEAGDPIFAGHYPGHPVYPGLCLVEYAHRSALAGASLLGRELELVELEAARFHRPVHPGDLVTADLRFTEHDEGWRCAARLHDGDAEIAFIRLRYRSPR